MPRVPPRGPPLAPWISRRPRGPVEDSSLLRYISANDTGKPPTEPKGIAQRSRNPWRLSASERLRPPRQIDTAPVVSPHRSNIRDTLRESLKLRTTESIKRPVRPPIKKQSRHTRRIKYLDISHTATNGSLPSQRREGRLDSFKHLNLLRTIRNVPHNNPRPGRRGPVKHIDIPSGLTYESSPQLQSSIDKYPDLSSTLTDEGSPQPQSSTGKRAISLLDELFPSNASIHRSKSNTNTPKPKRHIPKIALEVPLSPDTDSSLDRVADDTGQADYEQYRHNRSAAVLVLRKAGKHLSKSDFRRIIPGAKHIEGWTREGNILNMIRGRDLTTLDPDGTYILLFSTPASALTYRDHVLRLHQLSKSYLPNPTTNTPPIPFPPELSPSGRLTYGWDAIYALLPPSQELDLPMYMQPFSPVLRTVVEKMGYAPLIEGRRSQHEVLLVADWAMLSVSSLSRAVAGDGRARGIHWATLSNRTGIREVKMSSAGSKHVAARLLDGREDEDDGRSRGERKASKDDRKAEHEPARNDGRKRFIVSFRDEAEAKRFALAWHRRDIKGLLEGVPKHRAQVITEAEVIW